MTIPFLKMQGAANNFVVVDHRVPFLPGTDARLAPLIRRLCDRRRGVGADGVLLLEHEARQTRRCRRGSSVPVRAVRAVALQDARII